MRYIPDSFVACVEEIVVHKEMQQVASFSSDPRRKRPPDVSLPNFPSYFPPTEALPVEKTRSRSIEKRGIVFYKLRFTYRAIRLGFSLRLVSHDLENQSRYQYDFYFIAVPFLLKRCRVENGCSYPIHKIFLAFRFVVIDWRPASD